MDRCPRRRAGIIAESFGSASSEIEITEILPFRLCEVSSARLPKSISGRMVIASRWLPDALAAKTCRTAKSNFPVGRQTLDSLRAAPDNSFRSVHVSNDRSNVCDSAFVIRLCALPNTALENRLRKRDGNTGPWAISVAVSVSRPFQNLIDSSGSTASAARGDISLSMASAASSMSPGSTSPASTSRQCCAHRSYGIYSCVRHRLQELDASLKDARICAEIASVFVELIVKTQEAHHRRYRRVLNFGPSGDSRS